MQWPVLSTRFILFFHNHHSNWENWRSALSRIFFLRNLSHLYMLYIKNTYLGNKQYSTNMSRTENSISIFVCHHRRKIFFLQGQVVIISIFIIKRKMKWKDILHNQTTPNYYFFFGWEFWFHFRKTIQNNENDRSVASISGTSIWREKKMLFLLPNILEIFDISIVKQPDEKYFNHPWW